MHTRLLSSVFAATVLAALAGENEPKPVESIWIKRGELSVLFRDNSHSPELLSGVDALFNIRHAAGFDAFDPEGEGSSAGLNFEHIISGHESPENRFTPRRGPYSLYALPGGRSVVLQRRKEDEPWALSGTMRYTVREPYYIDMEFQCTAHDARKFGRRGYAILFWADYMNEVKDVAIHFLGINEPGGREVWVTADAPQDRNPHWNMGGTYRYANASPLAYDEDVSFSLNTWSYDYPRFTRPFYYGRAAHGMCYMLMFDRTFSKRDQVRFSLFKFKVRADHLRPAWDFQYVINKVEQGQTYGFKARAVWKKFVSAEDCLAEYNTWASRQSPR
jgi:hypothetical protein